MTWEAPLVSAHDRGSRRGLRPGINAAVRQLPAGARWYARPIWQPLELLVPKREAAVKERVLK